MSFGPRWMSFCYWGTEAGSLKMRGGFPLINGEAWNESMHSHDECIACELYYDCLMFLFAMIHLPLHAVLVMYACISWSVCLHFFLFPLLSHTCPSSLPSTRRRSILTHWSSTSLWVRISQQLMPHHSLSSSSLCSSFCVTANRCIIHSN